MSALLGERNVFIDIHAHVRLYPSAPHHGRRIFPSPEELLRRYDQIGVEKGCLLPLVSPEVYEPQSNTEILEVCRRHPDRFLPFCCFDPRGITNSPDAPFGEWLSFYREQGCLGVGEFMPNLPWMDERVQNLLSHINAMGLALIIDGKGRLGGTYGLYDDVGMPQMEASLQRFPRLRILGHGPAFWAEIAKVEDNRDRQGYPDGPVREEGRVAGLMRQYDNLYGDLSAHSGYNALARDRDYAVQFVNEFQDRLLFGTDICAPDTPTPLAEFLLDLRDRGEISDQVFNKVARENAVRLLGLSG